MTQWTRRTRLCLFMTAASLVLLPVVGMAQSLGDIAKKEKKRRAENGTKDVRVVDDTELATAESDRFSVTGVEAQSTTDGTTSRAKQTTPKASSPACAQLRGVEAEIARLKKTQQVRHVPRERRESEMIGPSGTRKRVVSVTPAHTINVTAQYSERIAALNKRWVELRKTCSE